MPSTVGLFVRLVAKPGRETEVEGFLNSALPLVRAEFATTAWFAVRLAPSSFAIFDVFPDEGGRGRTSCRTAGSRAHATRSGPVGGGAGHPEDRRIGGESAGLRHQLPACAGAEPVL